MSDPKVTSLQIDRMPSGGFLVSDAYRPHDGNYRGFHYAASTIDEALEYCRRKLFVDHITVVGEKK